MYYDWKRGERRASNTHKVRAKNPNFDLWKIKNELECTTIGRGQGEGFRHPESKVTNCHFEFHGVNSRFVLYTGTIILQDPQGWVPKQTMWRTSWAILDYFTQCLRVFSINQFDCFNIGTKFVLGSSKALSQNRILSFISVLPGTPTK